MNINDDSDVAQQNFMDEGSRTPKLPESSGCSMGPENIQISKTGVLAQSDPSSIQITMDYNSPHKILDSPSGQRTNCSVNTLINSPLRFVSGGTNNSFCDSGSESVNLSPNLEIPSSPVYHTGHPARKRLKLSDNDKASFSEDVSGLRRRILEYKLLRHRTVREKYAEYTAEYFYLQAGGNMMDYHAWRKRPPTPQLISYLRTYRLDNKDEDEDLSKILYRGVNHSQTGTIAGAPQGAEIKIPGVGATPVAISTTLPAAVAQLSQQGGTPLVIEGSGNLKSSDLVSSGAVGSTQLNTQEQIVEKAKQEAYVMQRISELQKDGLWTEKRLPKVMEPPRPKAHWDYLLEEMIWLAADFAQERKWKKAAAKKCARMVQKHFQEKALAVQRAEKAQELQLRRIASFVAKEIKIFWSNVEKLVEFKQQTKLEEERKRALDQQLSFIVDQTEKYSQQLAEGMRSHLKHHTSSKGSSTSAVPSDDEFCPSGAISSDDEETIAAAEKEDKNHGNEFTKAEVEALQRESQMDLDEFLNELPPNYLENRDKIKLSDDESERDGDGEDSEFHADEDSSDDEDTIMEQEKKEGHKDHKKEIDDLKAENEMSIDELMKMYSVNNCDKTITPETSDIEESDESHIEDTSDVEETEESATEDEGLDVLVKETDTKEAVGDEEHRMEDAAAIAESIQPTGNTLSSTQVVTQVPFLLRHSLREYQHIGLDWLVTMEQRRLNGILADEMGLGKTIQTIALLAHLACEKHDWGPHLVIVPTSVMLNWEMECKKWCPSFKILTYYGSIKERKLKRIGWTKPNAFHICITSYKLVIQDHQSFRRKKWKYLILDEAQNIKNFKSQRWQLLLNFQTQQRLLLTGTPLQNNLMELWSLMHFLMPDIFASHREFKEWFSNPVTGMIEGNSEYNENIIKRLHKVLRPFLLRRLKCEVEKQMPKKYEHVVMCRLSKRQRFLYDDFMSRAKTKETLATGNMLSVINVLMQLRKVCNHPNLFEARPTISPFQMEPIPYRIPSLVYNMLNYDPLKHVDLTYMNLNFLHLESNLTAFASYQTNRLVTPRKLIEEIDSSPAPPPRCPPAEFRLHISLRPITEQTASRQTNIPSHTVPPPGASPRPDTRRITSQAFPEPTKNDTPPSTRQRPILRVPPLQSGDTPALGGAADSSSRTNGLGTPSALGARIALLSPLTPRAHRQLSSARTAQVSPIVREKSPESNADQQPQSEFRQISTEECLKHRRKYKLRLINSVNERRCSASPIYGSDLRACCTVSNKFCDILQNDVNTIDSYVHKMNDIFDRFIVYICGAESSGVRPFISHGSVWKCQQEDRLQDHLTVMLNPVFSSVHPIASRLATHFPDPRLIQYDCGKLQTMDVLLRRLKSEQHRVLIFTQMTRMLDVLEAFLNFHGHIYLRLDGTTRIEHRQLLMERFNNDHRVFAFILSTRSGGVGINLTGADTVIFYDSDWNPTMDAQAQDRCHRIGQTRDVHIYRLISEKTVEENILKKANQKRMLGDVAIEGGNFTTAYFKSTTIQELFNMGTVAEVGLSEDAEPSASEIGTGGGITLESALAQCEDEADVAAARTARAEAAADLAEFDENIPIEEQQPSNRVEMTKAEMELQAVMDQLSPVERYAMRLVEASEAATSAERTAVADLERQRRDWQAARRAIAPPSPAAAVSDEDIPASELTFAREDADNQIWITNNSEEQMPMWCPPTPPQGDDDVYIDSSLYFLYEWNVMTESQLPPIYVKREAKRPRADTGHSPDGRRPLKMHKKEESVYAPRSLFERPSPAIVKMRRDLKLQKYRGIIRPSMPTSSVKPSPRPFMEPENVPEWTVAEDMNLLQAIKLQGHTPNWDLVSDMVNNTSRIYRSPRQCRNRYESIILPREEGKVTYDNNQKKQKKLKGSPKIHLQQKNGRPMRTSQLFEMDNNVSFTQSIVAKYDTMKFVLNKKATTPKRRYEDQTAKNPKHAAVLAEYGINYDFPPTPMDVATRRAERIAKEKQKTGGDQQAAAARLQAGGAVAATSAGASKVVPSPPPSSQSTPPSGTVSGISGNVAAARPRTAIVLAAQQVSTVVAKGSPGTVTAGGKPLNQAQIQQYRQQALMRQQLKIFQQATGGNQQPTIQTGVVTPSASVQTPVAVAGNQQRTHVPQTITRTVTDGEISALFKRHAVTQQKVGLQTQQVTQMFSTAINQQGQLQTAQPMGSVATVSLANAIAKAQTSTGIIGIATAPGNVATTSLNQTNMKMATPQQLRQLQLQQQLTLAQRKGQKVTQLAQVGAGAQVIVQAGGSAASHKNLSSGVVQQFQQVVRQPTTRVLPRHIQVVGNAVNAARTGNTTAISGTGVAPNTATHQVVLSQVSAALQARQQQVAQQNPNTQAEHQGK